MAVGPWPLINDDSETTWSWHDLDDSVNEICADCNVDIPAGMDVTKTPLASRVEVRTTVPVVHTYSEKRILTHNLLDT